MDWRDFLPVAEELAKRHDSTAHVRTAISRLYYACFHGASEKMKAFALEKAKQGGAHQKIWLAYENSEAMVLREIGSIGQKMHKLRIRADYHPAKLEELVAGLRYCQAQSTILLSLLRQAHH
jgi:uncharacterized protein (UPF0332 family)